MRRSGTKLPYIIFLSVLLSYVGFLLARQYGLIAERTPSEPAPPTKEVKHDVSTLTEFVLTDSNGKPFDSKSLDGKVWIGSFFFTNCPGSCWKMNQKIQALQEEFKDQDLQFVSISCDPDNDTPEALDRYAKHFQAIPGKWHFLTGDLKLVQQIGNDIFNVSVERQTHSDRLILIGKDGRVRARYTATEPFDLALLVKTVPQVLAEESTAR